MKIRQGFVSNSSSSSFIVYKEGTDINSVDFSKYKKYFKRSRNPYFTRVPRYKVILPLGKPHKFESFGWEFIKRGTFEDKVNFLFLQLHDLNNYCMRDNSSEDLENDFWKASKAFEVALKTILRKSRKVPEKVLLNILVDYNALEWDSIYEDETIGIDHQSLWTEEFWGDIRKEHPEELFKVCYPWLLDSEKVLQFLVGDSYIQCGNDNSDEEGEGYKEWKESRDFMVESIKTRLLKEEKEKE